MKKRFSVIVVIVIALAVAVSHHRTRKQRSTVSKTSHDACASQVRRMATDIELMPGELVLWWINNH